MAIKAFVRLAVWKMAKGTIVEVAKRIIGQLANLALQSLQDVGLLWGAYEDLQKLKDNVSTIKVVILDAEK